jgi:hypothetical protein
VPSLLQQTLPVLKEPSPLQQGLGTLAGTPASQQTLLNGLPETPQHILPSENLFDEPSALQQTGSPPGTPLSQQRLAYLGTPPSQQASSLGEPSALQQTPPLKEPSAKQQTLSPLETPLLQQALLNEEPSSLQQGLS